MFRLVSVTHSWSLWLHVLGYLPFEVLLLLTERCGWKAELLLFFRKAVIVIQVVVRICCEGYQLLSSMTFNFPFDGLINVAYILHRQSVFIS